MPTKRVPVKDLVDKIDIYLYTLFSEKDKDNCCKALFAMAIFDES